MSVQSRPNYSGGPADRRAPAVSGNHRADRAQPYWPAMKWASAVTCWIEKINGSSGLIRIILAKCSSATSVSCKNALTHPLECHAAARLYANLRPIS